MADPSIILGAQIRAIAQSVGLNEDQVIQMVLRGQRKGGRQLGREIGNDEAQSAVLRRLQKVAGVNEEMPGDIDQYRSVPNDQVAVGEESNQDRMQNFGGRKEGGGIKDVEQQLREMAGAEGKVDPNVIKRSRWDKAQGAFVTDEFYAADGVPIPADFQEAAKDKDFGVQVPNQFAPAQQVLRGELGRLQAGIDQYGADAFPGAAGVAGQIEDDLYGTKGAEQALAREMIARDRDGLASDEVRRRADLQLRREFGNDPGFGAAERAMPIDAYQVREQQILNDLGGIRQNPEAVEANNYRAQAEANILGQAFQQGGPGARADQAIENIGQIKSIASVKNKIEEDDVKMYKPQLNEEGGVPNALPVNLADQYNAPVTDNRFAGPLQRQEQWLADNAPGYREQGAFNDYPQVDIGGQLAAAQQGIEGINFGGQNVNLGERGIRNLDDLQGAVDQAVGLGQQQGVRFFNFQDGKNQFVANPGINEVLQKAGMNENQRGDLARALFAAEGARRNPANKAIKEAREGGQRAVPGRPVAFGADHPALGGGPVDIARLGGEKIEGKEVRGQLQALDGRRGNEAPLNVGELADARMPLIGGVAGNDIPRAAFVRGGDVNMTDGQRIEKYGPVNGEIANRVVRRFNEAGGYDGKSTPRLVESQMSAVPGYPGNTIDTQQAVNAQKAKTTQESLPGITYNERAPDPWSQEVGTGPGFTQVSTGTKGTRPQLALPYGMQTSGPTQDVTRPLNNELKNALAALNSEGSERGPRPKENFSDPGIRADGPSVNPRRIRQEADYRQSVRNLGRVRKFGRNAAIAGGAVAGLSGLDGLINGERNNRQEEQY